MITKSKLAELRKTWDDNGWYDEDPTTLMPELMDTISTLLDENEKLRRVKEAAEELRDKAYLACGYDVKAGDPPTLYDLRDIEKALAALEGKE